ncbi:MAG: 3-methyl-2-oxobutanoate hydroxymethyltransferase [Pseudomonadota bacterium]
MSVQPSVRRITVPQIAARKGGEPVVALTAYHAQTAAAADREAEVLLVGDSLGMVMHGMDSTLPVPLEVMILHGQAVMRGSRRALVVVDLPFGSYEESPQAAFHAAARVMKETGCGAVKLEGGARMTETIRFLTERGIPVMAHIGLTPQSTNMMGGFRTQGRDEESWPAHEADASAVAEAGAFCIVLEGMVEPLAARITRQVPVPTIGIGASAECDGQILVLEDMLGFNPAPPRFVRSFGALGEAMDRAISDYAAAVRERRFPGEENVYRPRR